MWIPILVVALMAALGAWRGVYRELAVSASVVLSALIVVQWATRERWSQDLSKALNGLGAGEWQFFLTLVLMGLIVAVVGYGLGGLFTRRSLSSTTRMLGALLGLANGAALTGWVLRAAFEGLVNKQSSSAVYQNPISQGLMIWAGWFPVALAVLGALAALVYSLRGDSVVTTEPEAVHATTVATLPPARPMYAPPPSSTYQPHAVPPAQARLEPYAPHSHYADAQSTVSMPAREQSALAPTSIYPVVMPQPPSGAPSHHYESLGAGQIASTSGYESSSNFAQDRVGAPGEQTPSAASERLTSDSAPHTPPFGYDLAALWGSEQASSNAAESAATSMSQPSIVATNTPTPAIDYAQDGGEIRCLNCGNRLPAGAAFCTECGTRVAKSV